MGVTSHSVAQEKPVASGSGNARRYSMVVVARAREHVEGGWSSYKTSQLLEQEFGVRPHLTTVRTWTDEKYAKAFAKKNRRNSRRSHDRRVGRKALTRVSAEWKLARMREMHDAQLSFEAIGVVAGLWWGEPLDAKTVARRLRRKPSKRPYHRSVVSGNDNNEGAEMNPEETIADARET
jgi:hypothetical protein